MGISRQNMRAVARIWGRRDLPPPFGAGIAREEPIGEIWFEDEASVERELLVKYLFTSERLSIQVHPDDEAARADGHARGKDEAWLVISADPGAVIGIGLRRTLSKQELRAAALDGRIEALMDWRPARVGDFYYSPAGTLHAIGAGLCLIEVQQNVDLTYRLYDYGRPRELHLDKAVAVADPCPYQPSCEAWEAGPGRQIIAAGGAFVVERWTGAGIRSMEADAGRPLTLIPIRGRASVEEQDLTAGSVWLVEGQATIAMYEESELLVAYPGSCVRPCRSDAGPSEPRSKAPQLRKGAFPDC